MKYVLVVLTPTGGGALNRDEVCIPYPSLEHLLLD